MNTHNDWEKLLQYANDTLEKSGYSLLITEEEVGCYSCEICKDGEQVETYAENYYENELSDLITEALSYVLNEMPKA